MVVVEGGGKPVSLKGNSSNGLRRSGEQVALGNKNLSKEIGRAHV